MEPTCSCWPVLTLHTITPSNYIELAGFYITIKNQKYHHASRIQNCIFGFVLSSTSIKLLFPPLHRALKDSTPSAMNASCIVLQLTVHEPIMIRTVSAGWNWKHSGKKQKGSLSRVESQLTLCEILDSISWLWRERSWLNHHSTIDSIDLHCKCIVEKEPGKVRPPPFIHHT